MSYDLLSGLRYAIDRAVDAGMTKQAIIRVLEEAEIEVSSDPDILDEEPLS